MICQVFLLMDFQKIAQKDLVPARNDYFRYRESLQNSRVFRQYLDLVLEGAQVVRPFVQVLFRELTLILLEQELLGEKQSVIALETARDESLDESFVGCAEVVSVSTFSREVEESLERIRDSADIILH